MFDRSDTLSTSARPHNFESILPKDHPCHVCFKLADWFQKRRLLNNFPIAELSKSLSCLSDNRSGRCGQCVRPIPPSKMAAMSRHSFNIEPYGSMGFE
jgi:hypothetical protein